MFASAATPAPEPVAAPPAARGPTPYAVVADDFESYAPGALAGQGAWWNPNATGEDYVVNGGIAGRSGRVFANATAGLTWSAGRTFAADYGVLTVAVRAPALDTPFLFGPFSDTNPNTGYLDPQGTLALGADRVLSLFQRTAPDAGDYVRLFTQVPEGAVATLSWDVRADGALAVYRDGRLLTVGRAEAAVLTGAPKQLGAVLFGSANGVPRSSDGSRNTLTFDSIAGTLPAVVDPAGQADLALVATYGTAPLGQALRTVAEVPRNGRVALTLYVLNTSSAAASGVHIGGVLPQDYTLSSSDCPVNQTGTAWTTATFALAGAQTRACHLILHLEPAAAATGGWEIPLGVSASTTDPYGENDVKTVTVRAGIFASGFE